MNKLMKAVQALTGIFLAVMLTACFDATRDNPNDPKSDNYSGGALEGTLIRVTPGTYDFGDTVMGASPQPTMTITIENISATQTLDIINTVTSDTMVFPIEGAISYYDMQAGESPVSFIVRFNPTVVGPAEGTITITSNDPTLPTAYVELTGNGITSTVGAWTTQLNLSSDSSLSSMPCIAADSSGNAIAVWNDDANVQVKARIYDSAGKIWDTVSRIDNVDANTHPSRPCVAMTPGGNATIVWIEDTPANMDHIDSKQCISSAYTGITTVFTANAAGDTLSSPDLAINDTGYAIVAYVFNGSNVYSNIYTASWFGPFGNGLINTSYGKPKCAVDINGIPFITFPDQATMALTVKRYHLGATPGWDEANNWIADNIYKPQIAVTGTSGVGVLTWAGYDGAQYQIYAKDFDSTIAVNTWDGVYSTLNTTNLGVDKSNPALAMNSSNDGIVIWQETSGNTEIWGRYFSGGMSGLSASDVQITSQNTSLLDVGIDNSGNVTAVWSQANSILARRYTASTGVWGDPVTLGTATDSINSLDLSVSDTGAVFVIWAQTNAGNSFVCVSQYQ